MYEMCCDNKNQWIDVLKWVQDCQSLNDIGAEKFCTREIKVVIPPLSHKWKLTMGKLPTISRTTIARCATQKIKRSMNGKGLSPWFPRLARLHILPSIKELDEPKLIETHSEEYYIIKHCPYSRAKDCHSKQTKKVKNEDTRYTPNGIRRSKSFP